MYQISLYKILNNKTPYKSSANRDFIGGITLIRNQLTTYYIVLVKVQLNRFHLNVHTIEFRPQTHRAYLIVFKSTAEKFSSRIIYSTM